MLKSGSFWSLKPEPRPLQVDGSTWIIEAHTENKYWCVERYSPEGTFRDRGEYLIQLSGLHEIIY